MNHEAMKWLMEGAIRFLDTIERRKTSTDVVMVERNHKIVREIMRDTSLSPKELSELAGVLKQRIEEHGAKPVTLHLFTTPDHPQGTIACGQCNGDSSACSNCQGDGVLCATCHERLEWCRYKGCD